MKRPGRSPIKPGLISVVALLVVASSLRSPADEPTPKGAVAKAPDAKKIIEAAAKHKDAALKSAEAYLVLLDRGKYAEGWEASSSGHRNLIPKPKWVDALNKARRPFGRPRRRKLNRVELRGSEEPGQIDQAWVYTKFETQDGLTPSELVIVSFEKATEWKVSHYFIGDPDGFPKPPEVEKKASPEGEEKDETKPAEEVEKKATKPARKSS